MTTEPVGLAEARQRYAKLMVAASKSDDPRLEQAFAGVPREAFLGPGPWQIFDFQTSSYREVPSDDPVQVYQNVLVALDRSRGINNGEPTLHAAWIGAVAPQAGETVCHIGAGSGYYSAILSKLVMPGGCVHAIELDATLAARATANLQPCQGVSVTRGDATILPIPPSDLIYVNAGVTAPPLSWLQALRPRGRLIFPWRPSKDVGLAVVVSRRADALQVRPLSQAWFIPCIGASTPGGCIKAPNASEAWSTRSIWQTSARPPDDTAVAIYQDIWFSTAEVP